MKKRADRSRPSWIACLILGLGLAGSAWASGENCRITRTTADLCANYSASPALANDPNVQIAKKSCEAFYAEAIKSVDLICDFKTDVENLREEAKGISTCQTGGMSEQDYLAAKIRTLLHQYANSSSERIADLQRAQEESSQVLKKLAKKGAENLKAELHCKQDGVPGQAPGPLLIGLAKQSLEDQDKTRIDVQAILERLHNPTNFNHRSSEKQIGKLQQVQTGAAPTISDHVGQESPMATGLRADPGIINLTDLAMGPGVDTTSIFIERLLGPVVGKIGGFSLDIVTSTQVDEFAIANAGIAAVLDLAGLSVMGGMGIGLYMDLIEGAIRHELAVKEARILVPYMDHLKKNPGVTSGEVAASYRTEKQSADYCKKCNSWDLTVSQYCPARNEFNPDWYSENDHHGPNQWKNPSIYGKKK